MYLQDTDHSTVFEMCSYDIEDSKNVSCTHLKSINILPATGTGLAISSLNLLVA